MQIDLFDYNLPQDLIAQTPVPRGTSRLLVLDRQTNTTEHRIFTDLPSYLRPGDTLVLNDTRVTARRLFGTLPTGKPAEVFLLRPIGERDWLALVRPGKALQVGKSVILEAPAPASQSITATVQEILPDGSRRLEFATAQERNEIADWGVAPLPPYIETPLPHDQEERYQTVYASTPGSAAAPTAGLHFTEELLEQVVAKGVNLAYVTLHVGIDTFRPVKVQNLDAHVMHGEWLSVSQEAADIVNRTTGRVIAVGTTSVRALESAANRSNPQEGLPSSKIDRNDDPTPRLRVAPFVGDTHLFITPGYRFKAVDALITNFHLPRSTLLMLISALAGRETILAAYEEAIRLKYRFFSFGDAMLIL